MDEAKHKIIFFIILFLILIVVVSVISKSQSFTTNNQIQNNDSNNIEETITNNDNEDKVVTHKTYEEEKKARFFYSKDHKYYLVLIDNYRSYSNSSMGTRDKRYLLNIDNYYSTENITGTYEINNNKITLKVETGCLDENNNFNCVVPDNTLIEKKEDINYMSLTYKDNEILLGNISLIEQN